MVKVKRTFRPLRLWRLNQRKEPGAMRSRM